MLSLAVLKPKRTNLKLLKNN